MPEPSATAAPPPPERAADPYAVPSASPADGEEYGGPEGGGPGGGGPRDRPDDLNLTRPEDAVWSYRGYHLRASEFTTAMVHFFRAEISRANTWRHRLDTTTNWAVLTTGAAVSIAFGGGVGRTADHGVIILNTLLVTMFLAMEARRYRYYELWSYRVRLMETDFFAAMLVPPFRPSADWAESLAENLLMPRFPISIWEAFGRRLRHNYMWIYLLLAAAWVMKVWLHPDPPAQTLDDFMIRAAIGTIPGQVVVLFGLFFNLALFAIGLLTLGLQQATGEILPRYGQDELPDEDEAAGILGAAQRAWFRRSGKRAQLLTFVITDQATPVARRLMKELGRGVTALAGTGMYTGKAHSVLMCALTVTEVPQLEALVHELDPKAFVIVTPVKEVRGSGFVPLTGAQAPAPGESYGAQ